MELLCKIISRLVEEHNIDWKLTYQWPSTTVTTAWKWTSRLSSVTHVDDKCQRLSWVVFNQLLLAGGEELRVLHVFQQEVAFMRFLLLFLQLVIEGGRAASRVEDSVQEELDWGLLGLAGRWGWAGDRGRGEHGAALWKDQKKMAG